MNQLKTEIGSKQMIRANWGLYGLVSIILPLLEKICPQIFAIKFGWNNTNHSNKWGLIRTW